MDYKEFQNAVEKTYKYQIGVFKLIGCWRLSDKASKRLQWIYKLYYLYVLIFWILLLDIGLFIYVVEKLTDIDEVLNVLFALATLVAFLVKYLRVKFKTEEFKSLLKFLKSEIFAGQNSREEKLLKSAFKSMHNLRNGYGLISINAFAGIMLTKVITYNFQLPLNIYTPYSLEKKSAFVLTYVYEFIVVAIGCLCNISFDSLCPCLLIFVKVQLEILGDRLIHLSETTNDEDDEVRQQLKANMRFYENITKLLKITEGLISLPFSVQIMCSILVLIANFYALSMVHFLLSAAFKLDKLINLYKKLSGSDDYTSLIGFSIYQCCMMLQIFLICYFANEVTLCSLTLSQALYGADWMLWNKKNRKDALLMMKCYSVPLRLKSINRNYSFNLPAFTSIVNCSYSYFALLKNINN